MATRLEMPRFQAFDSNGDPLSGGLLYTYVVGSTTPKSTYTDAAAGTAQANPIVLNARGEPDTSIYGIGYYKLVLKDSAGSTIWTIPSIAGVNEVAFTCLSDYSGSIPDAIAAISSTATTLFIDTTSTTMAANATFHANTKVVVLRGGMIAKSTYTVTFNGPLEAGPHQIFTGSGAGTIVINANEYIYADWFGSAKSDVTLAAMLSMVGSSTGHAVKFSAQAWAVDASVSLTSNYVLDVPKGCTFALASSQTLTSQGFLNAGPYQIFSGSGTAVMHVNPTFYAEWWGIDGTADQTEINLAIVAAAVKGGTVQLLGKTYTLSASVLMKSAVHLRGMGNNAGTTGTKLYSTSGIEFVEVDGASGLGCEVSNMYMLGTGAGSQVGLYLYASGSVYPTQCRFHDLRIDTMLNNVQITAAEHCMFENVECRTAETRGWLISSASKIVKDVRFTQCSAINCEDYGFVISTGSSLYFDGCLAYGTDDAAAGTGIGFKIQGDAAWLYFNRCFSDNNGLYAIDIEADTANYPTNIIMRDTRVVLPGNNATEVALYAHASGGGSGVDNCIFDNVEISKNGGTAPTDVISITCTTARTQLLNIKDTIGTTTDNTTMPDSVIAYTNVYKRGVATLPTGATPSVAGGSTFYAAAGATITDLLGGVDGQIVTILCSGVGAVDVTDAGNLALSAAFSASTGDTITLMYRAAGDTWYEIARSAN